MFVMNKYLKYGICMMMQLPAITWGWDFVGYFGLGFISALVLVELKTDFV